MDSKNNPYYKFEQRHEVPFSKSKEVLWDELMQKNDISHPSTVILFKKYYYVAAAAACILLSLVALARFYKKVIICPAGEHVQVEFACGSKVNLNADSKMTYYPYWWKISRITTLQGEAYFEVVPRNSFIVKSDFNTSCVLGTRFNIFSRNKVFRLFCISGKVKTISHSGESLIVPDGMAVLQKLGRKLRYEDVSEEQALGWKNKMLIYTAKPINDVFREIERQYNVSIEEPDRLNALITGAYPMDIEIEELLTIICKPFNISNIKISEKKYKLTLN